MKIDSPMSNTRVLAMLIAISLPSNLCCGRPDWPLCSALGVGDDSSTLVSSWPALLGMGKPYSKLVILKRFVMV